MAIPAYFFPSTVASTSDAIDFGSFDNPCVGDTSLCFGATVHILSNPPAGNDARIICKQAGSSDTQHEFMLSLINTNALRVRLRAGGSTATIISANNLIPFDQTFRIACTYDGASIRAWINGVETTSGSFPATKTGSLNAVANSELWLGNGLPGSRNMRGYIGEGFGDIYWEPERLKAWGAGEPLGNLLRRPFFWADGDEWAQEGRTKDRWIANRAQGYPGVPKAGFVEQDVYSALMPEADRRVFVPVVFPDFPILDSGGELGLVREVGETLEAAEGLVTIVAASVVRVVAETAEILESVADGLAALVIRAVAETLHAIEGLARMLGLTRPATETLNLSEAPLAGRVLARLVAEVSQGVELRLRALGATRIVAEIGNPTEATAQVKNFAEGAKLVIKLVGRMALATPLAALRRTVISLTGKIES